jgi:hypothetical protein
MLIMLQGTVAFVQLILRSTVGILIEQTNLIPHFGAGADEDALQFRPVGLTTHANILAYWIFCASIAVLLLSTMIDRSVILKPRIYQSFVWTIGIGLFVLGITQSRSAMLAAIAAIGIIVFHNLTILWNVIRTSYITIKRYKFIFIVAVAYLSIIIPTRALYSVYSLSPSGGITTRSLLNTDAITLLNMNPFLGVGTNMFIPAAFKLDPTGVMKYFPEAVHNGFLLLLSENGYIVFMLYVGYIYLIIRTAISNGLTSIGKSILIAGIVGSSIIMLFQPFFEILPLYLVIFILSTAKPYEDIYDK